MELKNLERLPEFARKDIQKYCEEMIKIHDTGGNLESIVVYGSILTADYHPHSSNINILFVFREITSSVLSKSLKTVQKGIGCRIAVPLFINRNEMFSSTDVFPMEFLDIKENHLLLWGKDLLTGIEISQKNLRLQVEQELRGKILKLRQGYLDMGEEENGVKKLILSTFSSFFPVFRNILRLKGLIPLVDREKIIIKLSEMFSLNKDIFLAIMKTKKDKTAHLSKNDFDFFFEYLQELEKIVGIVDKL